MTSGAAAWWASKGQKGSGYTWAGPSTRNSSHKLKSNHAYLRAVWICRYPGLSKLKSGEAVQAGAHSKLWMVRMRWSSSQTALQQFCRIFSKSQKCLMAISIMKEYAA